jgi:hypothetical protein
VFTAFIVHHSEKNPKNSRPSTLKRRHSSHFQQNRRENISDATFFFFFFGMTRGRACKAGLVRVVMVMVVVMGLL